MIHLCPPTHVSHRLLQPPHHNARPATPPPPPSVPQPAALLVLPRLLVPAHHRALCEILRRLLQPHHHPSPALPPCLSRPFLSRDSLHHDCRRPHSTSAPIASSPPSHTRPQTFHLCVIPSISAPLKHQHSAFSQPPHHPDPCTPTPSAFLLA